MSVMRSNYDPSIYGVSKEFARELVKKKSAEKKPEEKKAASVFYTQGGQPVCIEKVVYNLPAVIVFWSDGTKTISKCCSGDIYSNEVGLAMCLLKKISNINLYNFFEDWADERVLGAVVTAKDVEKKRK